LTSRRFLPSRPPRQHPRTREMPPSPSVNFTGTATGGTGTFTYSWNFGDGTSSSSQNPSHTYSTPDDYTAKLTVDDGNRKTEKTLTITVQTPPLSANPTVTPNSGKPPLSVNFTANVTGGTKPYIYDWDFGDGTASSVSQNPPHTYSEAGTYSVAFTVRDANNQIFPKTLTVKVRLAEQTGTNPEFTWTGDNETFKVALVGTGTITLMNAAVNAQEVGMLVQSSAAGDIVLYRKKPNNTWVELERKTYTAVDVSQKKSISLAGPAHKYYYVHLKLCAWDMGGKTSMMGQRTEYHGWDDKDSLPSEFGADFKIYDISGTHIRDKFVDFKSNEGKDLDNEDEDCTEWDTTPIGMTQRPVFFVFDMWENDCGLITKYDTGFFCSNDDDKVWDKDWAHNIYNCNSIATTANCYQECFRVEKDTLSSPTLQQKMGGFSSSNMTQSNTKRVFFLIDDKDISVTTKANKTVRERWYIFRHSGNHPQGMSDWINPSDFTVGQCYDWSRHYEKAYIKIRVWVTEGK